MKREMETEDAVAALSASGCEGVVGLFTIGKVQTDGVARREGRIDAYFNTDDGILGIGCEVNVVDVMLATSFEIDGLPNAANVAVTLFARETLVVGGVVGHNDEVLRHIVEASEVPGDFNFEGSVATLVGGDVTTVEVDLGVPFAGTDDEEDALVAPSAWNDDIAGIVTLVAFVGDTGKGRAPTERDGDLVVEVGCDAIFCGVLATFGIERELPGAVEVDPVGAFEVGTRMLGERDGLGDGGRDGEGEEG